MIVIGIDSHNDTLAGALADQRGRLVTSRSFPNTPKGHTEVVSWTQSTDAERVAVEGSGKYGRPLALALLEAGVDTVEVPPQMTARARRGQRTGTKTDQSDALLIARIGAREPDLPRPRPQGAAEDLRCLVFYRRELVQHRQRTINRLHSDPEQLRCGYQHKIPTRLTSPQALTRISRLLSGDTTTRGLVAKHRIAYIRRQNRQIDEITTQIESLIRTCGTPLTDIYGIGDILAAEILAEVGDPTRYPTKAKFAMANGTAPLEASSGRVKRHRLNRGGNRQLNRAIHIAATTQINRPGTEGRTFYQKKLAAGKSKREATRALKRRISDRIWTHLQPPKTHPHLT